MKLNHLPAANPSPDIAMARGLTEVSVFPWVSTHRGLAERESRALLQRVVLWKADALQPYGRHSLLGERPQGGTLEGERE